MNSRSSVFALLPRAGLANRLFVWAHAQLYSQQNQLPVATHGWGHIHIGPWLRNEQSKRFYYFFFKNQTNFIGYYYQWVLSKLNLREFIIEPDFSTAVEPTGKTYCFKSVPNKKDYFKNLRGSENYLRSQLTDLLRPKYRQQLEALEPYSIALHIRRGDFIQAGCVLSSEDYFIQVVKKLRSKLGTQATIRIFSDGTPEDFPKLLKLPNVSMASRKADIIELLEISIARIIVTSLGSTYGYWAAFLSNADIILDDRHEFGCIRDPESSDHFEGTIDQYLEYAE